MHNPFKAFIEKVAVAFVDDGRDPVDKNPVDEALEAEVTTQQKLAARRQADELEMWKQWKQKQDPDTTHQLLKRFEPVINNKVRQWRAPVVPEPAFKANLKNNAIEAFKTYDPNKGASLRTHLENRLQKSKRFNVQQQNYAYIPEAKAARIGDIQRATDELTEDLGRQPSSKEISDFLNPQLSSRQRLTPKKVQSIQQGQIGDVVGSTFESDPTPQLVSREREVIGLLRPTLQRDQQEVFDYLFGENGKPKITSTTELAKKLGKSPSQVSRIRTGINNKFKSYL